MFAEVTARVARDRQAFLDISDLRYGDLWDLPVPRQRGRRPSAPRGDDDTRVNRAVRAEESATVREQLTVPLSGFSSERSGGGLPAIDGMAGVGKTAFARRAAQEFATRYPDGAIWVDLYGHTPGMQPRESSGALEQMLAAIGRATRGDQS